ncbi:MAG: Fe-S cluster assembly protein SufD [Silanimonas sp.]
MSTGAAPATGTLSDAMAAHGLTVPTTRSERWKYTNLRALAARRFAAPDGRPDVDLKVIADVPAPRLVIANGRYAPALSDLHGLAEGLRVRLLSEVLRDAPAEAAAWLATDADVSANRSADAAFQQWNGALADEGFVLEVDAGVRVDAPLHLIVLGVEDGAERAFHLRHRIVLGAGAALTVAKHHLGAGAHRHLLNTVLQVELGEGAALTQARVQREADGATLLQRTQATLGANAHYRRLDLELGGALSRHELDVVLAGHGAQLEANGVLLADGRRHLDTRLGIEHRGRETRCELVWRGIGAQRGRAVFHGGILITEGADGSNAALSNKNLLLDDGAEIDTQPVLVIHADDVQAAHGATVGRLDDAALFYLRARGLPKDEAAAMLTGAFLREPLAVLGHEGLEVTLAAALDARLAGASA